MSINKYNADGHIDPTAYEALTQIERAAKQRPYLPLTSICSPFKGDVQRNILNAQRYCTYAVTRDGSPSRRTCCSRSSWTITIQYAADYYNAYTDYETASSLSAKATKIMYLPANAVVVVYCNAQTANFSRGGGFFEVCRLG